MEGVSDQLLPQPAPEKLRFDAANDFLTTCDRLSTGYDSGYYAERDQIAGRIIHGPATVYRAVAVIFLKQYR
ncbi:hypothetical protein GCM10027185_54900 [Spirosoma pulveris]